MLSINQIRNQLVESDGKAEQNELKLCRACFAKALAVVMSNRCSGYITTNWSSATIGFRTIIQDMLDQEMMHFCVDCKACFMQKDLFATEYERVRQEILKELTVFLRDMQVITQNVFIKLGESERGRFLAGKWKMNVTATGYRSYIGRSGDMSSYFKETKDVGTPGFFWIEAEKEHLDFIVKTFDDFNLGYLYAKKIYCSCDFDVDESPCECDAKNKEERNLMRLEVSLQDLASLVSQTEITPFIHECTHLPLHICGNVVSFFTPREVITMTERKGILDRMKRDIEPEDGERWLRGFWGDFDLALRNRTQNHVALEDEEERHRIFQDSYNEALEALHATIQRAESSYSQ